MRKPTKQPKAKWWRAPLPAVLDESELPSLLKLEKRRRRVAEDRLVFAGMHNIAQFWWCGMYSVRKSRRRETDFFGVYVVDRLRVALALGRIPRMPATRSGILDAAAAEIPLPQVEALIADSGWPAPMAAAPQRRPSKVLGPSGLKELDPDEIEAARAERYPTFRWAFAHGRYALVGVPDGITPEMVYEFKGARNRHFFLTAARPVGSTQADLYGMFFGRKRKRVQVLVKDEDYVETIDVEVDLARAAQTLERFASVESGSLPLPPRPYKCQTCEEAEGCPMRQDAV